MKGTGLINNLLIRRNERYEIQVADEGKFELIKQKVDSNSSVLLQMKDDKNMKN